MQPENQAPINPNPNNETPTSPPVPPYNVQPLAQPYAQPTPNYGTQPNMQPPAPGQYGQPAVDPGKKMGIAGIILAFIWPIVGLILSIISMNKSKKAGFSNGPALAGTIISPIMMLLQIIMIIISVSLFLSEPSDSYDEPYSFNDGTSQLKPIEGIENNPPASQQPAGNELNRLGTVADPTLQRDIISYIATAEQQQGRTGELSVSKITSRDLTNGLYMEDWTVRTGQNSDQVYGVSLSVLASGGTDIKVTSKTR